MPKPEIDSVRYPKTAAVQQWVDNEKEKGLVDIKFFARHSDESNVESFSSEVLEMRDAAVIGDIPLD